MKLNTVPQHEAVMSNVAEIGEYRIKNSAKAFNILSSQLYANKIRAIVRELSCNAVDSHVAAGKKDTQFEIHLPSELEPWFSIRDFGTGLNHHQVTNIYTTYFESTKTDSNDFIGALGLGSKSPFSYTDNYTVTAIKDGRKGIYSAFINSHGVPGIALMMEEQTNEASGVEVKFSVNEYYDFRKFAQETRDVFTHFSQRPIITGNDNFEFNDVTYSDKDIVPGVHKMVGCCSTVAVMGNIAYPINIPNPEVNLGPLAALLSCQLEMHFEIGELDFQASREGLSYIPQTINAIKAKLMALNDCLTGRLTADADAIANLWERAAFLDKRKNDSLWGAAVRKYVQDTKFPLMTNPTSSSSYFQIKTLDLDIAELAKKYNIDIRGFQMNYGRHKNSMLSADSVYINAQTQVTQWRIHPNVGVQFVVNDLKIGAVERAKHHYRNHQPAGGDYSGNIYVISAHNKTKKVEVDQFFIDIFSPKAVIKASQLTEKPRKGNGLGQNISILSLQKRGGRSYSSANDMVWRAAGELKSFDDTVQYYYFPLKGFEVQTAGQPIDCKTLMSWLSRSGISSLSSVQVYGVRKADLEAIEDCSNWINLEQFISDELTKIDPKTVTQFFFNEVTDEFRSLHYDKRIAQNVTNPNSEYLSVVNQIKDMTRTGQTTHCMEMLCARFAPSCSVATQLKAFRRQVASMYKKYPLLSGISNSIKAADIAEYINMVDEKKP